MYPRIIKIKKPLRFQVCPDGCIQWFSSYCNPDGISSTRNLWSDGVDLESSPGKMDESAKVLSKGEKHLSAKMSFKAANCFGYMDDSRLEESELTVTVPLLMDFVWFCNLTSDQDLSFSWLTFSQLLPTFESIFRPFHGGICFLVPWRVSRATSSRW